LLEQRLLLGRVQTVVQAVQRDQRRLRQQREDQTQDLLLVRGEVASPDLRVEAQQVDRLVPRAAQRKSRSRTCSATVKTGSGAVTSDT
jgi:hypothetical protein